MHGRLKVKTTAEQQEEKRKEREKKANAFTKGMNEVFKNRGNADAHKLVLNITEKLLSGNPDVYTLWNIRKEVFVEMQKSQEDFKDVFYDELKFLQNCLSVNPKSYGVWNQRRFVMLTMTHPNWHDELQLCNLFLQYDERNFHCWDYRRFVVKQANVSPEEEFNFTTQKIIENFSNYSAWHNRSKLLPLVKPDPTESGKVEKSALLKEFELAQNAFFTDPNDQSAWFYQRWLLGKRRPKIQLLSLCLQREPLILIASFSQPVDKPSTEHCVLNGEPYAIEWKSSETIYTGSDNTCSCVWISNLETEAKIDLNIKVSFPEIKDCIVELKLNLQKDCRSTNLCWIKDTLSVQEDNSFIFSSQTATKKSVLQNELDACKMLLEEEEDNKWTMLTIIYLMHALNCKQYMSEIEELLARLIKVDQMRTGYYKDLRSKYRIENELERLSQEKSELIEVDLSGMDLTCFMYGQYLNCCKKLNLSNNNLTNSSFCTSLIGVEELILTNNPLLDDVVKITNMFPQSMNISI